MNQSFAVSPTRKMLAFEAAEEPEESWILSYLDVFVLIATLFIVLTIIAQLKLEQQQDQQSAQQQALTQSQTELVAVQQQLTELTSRSGDAAFETAAASLPALLAEQQWNDELIITSHDDYTELQIRDRVLFASAEAALLPEGNALLSRLVPLLQRSPGMIYIEGHTDNQPIDTLQFHSNWELAAARATNVLQYFASQGVASKRLRAVSVADTAPIASNRHENGRAQNRRVTILVRQNETPATSLAAQ